MKDDMKIRLFNKVIVEGFDHYVYSIDTDHKIVDHNVLTYKKITKENMDEAGAAIGNTTGKWILNDYPFARGYIFYDPQGHQVGSCWLMFKGGDEKLYRIRKSDSFIFRLEVDEAYQGKGYSKMIMDHMLKIASAQGAKNVCLVCARKNSKAVNLYEKIGMKRSERKIFFRVFDRNIPYYEL